MHIKSENNQTLVSFIVYVPHLKYKVLIVECGTRDLRLFVRMMGREGRNRYIFEVEIEI